jgi:cell division septum initiation protein DivIVA
MRDARNEVTRTHQSQVDTIKDVLKEALDIRGQIDKLQPKVKELMESAIKLSKPEPNISVKTMPGHYHLVPGSDGRGQLVRNNATFAVNLQETPSQRATRISELTRVHEERKKIDQDLSKLRAQQSELVAKRHEEDRNHKLSRDDARKERVARLEEQRALEEQLQSLNKALRRTMALREGLDSIAAYIPWNVEVEGEALWLALTAKSTSRP